MSLGFQLFVTGRTTHSQRAIQVARALVADGAFKGYALEVIDVVEQPEVAEEHRVLATPTLLCPPNLPVRRLLGDLGDLTRVHRALGVVESKR
ncbi:MAG: circadian clock KaiB family protein [Deltaproteobacteria bacterium]